MKLFIIGENPIVPYVIEQLKDLYDIKVDLNTYTKDLDIEKLSVSDLTLKTSFADAILLLNLDMLQQKIILKDGTRNLNESVFEIFQKSLWFTLNTNDELNRLIDKFDLNHFNLSNTTPFFITSKLALSELFLEKIIHNSPKLLHQQKVLMLGYSDTSRLISETLSTNRMIVIVCDRFLQKLVEAKKDGYGIVLKEELNTLPITFDFVIVDDEFFINFLKRNDIHSRYFINYKEGKNKAEDYEQIEPYKLICAHYTKLIGQNIASSLKKEIKEYFKGA